MRKRRACIAVHHHHRPGRRMVVQEPAPCRPSTIRNCVVSRMSDGEPSTCRCPSLMITSTYGFPQAAVAIYRLAISGTTIGYIRFSSLEQSITRQTRTGVSNSAAAGPLFLVFHLLPEWMSVALLIGTSPRKDIESGDNRPAPSTDIPV